MEFLGRKKGQRKSAVDNIKGYRNGYGKTRKLATTMGTITVRRPRMRGTEEHFQSKVLPLFAKRTKEVGHMLPELYLHGLALGDFEMAMRGLLGDGAPLSASSIDRLKAKWKLEAEMKERATRLEFEKAAELRDKIKAARELMLKTGVRAG